MFNFYYFQTLTNTIKPQLQTSNLKPFLNPNKTQIKSEINSFKHQTDTHTQSFKHQPSHGFMKREFWMNRTSIEEKLLGEKDPWLHKDRAEEEQKINRGGERFWREKEREWKFQKKWMFGYKDSEIWNN